MFGSGSMLILIHEVWSKHDFTCCTLVQLKDAPVGVVVTWMTGCLRVHEEQGRLHLDVIMETSWMDSKFAQRTS